MELLNNKLKNRKLLEKNFLKIDQERIKNYLENNKNMKVTLKEI